MWSHSDLKKVQLFIFFFKMAESDICMKELCNYCKRKASKRVIKCPNCDRIYHKSCANRVTCCEVNLMEQKIEEINVTGEENEDEEVLSISNELLMENQELKQINKKLSEEIIQLKQTVKDVQKENDRYRRREKSTNTMNEQITNFILEEVEKRWNVLSKDLNAIKCRLNNFESIIVNDTPIQKKQEQKNSYDENKVCAKQKTQQEIKTKKFHNLNEGSSLEMENKQRQIMSEIINLENSPLKNNHLAANKQIISQHLDEIQNNNCVNNSDSKDSGFIYPKNRKWKQKTVIGDKENAGKLRAVDPLSFIFVSRLEPNTTQEDVEMYLKDQDIIVNQCTKLKIFSNEIAAFKLAVRKADEQKVYCAQTWPRETIIRPYNSNRLKNFQKISPATLRR